MSLARLPQPLCVLIAVAALAAAALAATPAVGQEPSGRERARGGEPAAAAGKQRPLADYPWQRRVRRAARFARRRAGAVSFAVVDERGRIHGWHRGARYSSASVVKAMLLVAYLRKGGVRGRRLHGSEKATLGPMIRRSDNGAADAIHAQRRQPRPAAARPQGRHEALHPQPGPGAAARSPRATRLGSSSASGGLIPERHRSYALGLLRRIVPGQRWGVPPGRPKGWRVHFKGGWYRSGGGWRVHQAALLRRGDRRLSIAVLTEGGPGLGYGAGTITGVTRRLLRGYNAYQPGKRGKGGGQKKSRQPRG